MAAGGGSETVATGVGTGVGSVGFLVGTDVMSVAYPSMGPEYLFLVPPRSYGSKGMGQPFCSQTAGAQVPTGGSDSIRQAHRTKTSNYALYRLR